MSDIEDDFKSLGYKKIAKMPLGAQKFGARKAIVISLVVLGLGLLVTIFVLK